jgi:glutamate synthase (ferredoxin)
LRFRAPLIGENQQKHFTKVMPIDYKIALQRLADEKKIEELIA